MSAAPPLIRPGGDARCPRCGESFQCGATAPRCDCFELQLTAAQRQQLAEQYSGCLCITCLKALQAATSPSTARRPTDFKP